MAKNWWDDYPEAPTAAAQPAAKDAWWEAYPEPSDKVTQTGAGLGHSFGIGSGMTVRGAGEFVQAPVENVKSAGAQISAGVQRVAADTPNLSEAPVDPMGAMTGAAPEYSDSRLAAGQQQAAGATRRAQEASDVATKARAANVASGNPQAVFGRFLEDSGESAQTFHQDRLKSEAPYVAGQQDAIQKAEGFWPTIKESVVNPIGAVATGVQSIPDMAVGMAFGAGVGKVARFALEKSAAEAGTKAFQQTIVRAASNPETMANATKLARDAQQKVTQEVIQKGAEQYAGLASLKAEAIQSGMSNRIQVQDFVRAQPEENLQQNPRYQELLKEYDPTTARELLANELGDASAPGAALWTAIAGKLSGAAMAEGKVLANGKISLGGAARNLGKEMLEEGAQNPGENYAQYAAQKQVDPTQKFDLGGSIAQGLVGGLVQGGPMHGGGYISSQVTPTPARLAGKPIDSFPTETLQRYSKAGVLSAPVQEKVDAELERRGTTEPQGDQLGSELQRYASANGAPLADGGTAQQQPADAVGSDRGVGAAVPQRVDAGGSTESSGARVVGDQPVSPAGGESAVPLNGETNAPADARGAAGVVEPSSAAATASTVSDVGHEQPTAETNDAHLAAGRAIVKQWAEARQAQGLSSKAPVLGEITDPEIKTRADAVADALHSVFGTRPVMFHDPSAGAPDGFAINGQSYVNAANLEQGIHFTAFHETWHVAEQRAADGDVAAKAFVEAGHRIFDMMSQEGKRAYAQHLLDTNQIGNGQAMTAEEALAHPKLRSEMVGDFFGHRGEDIKFLRHVAKADPKGFGGFIRTWIDSLTNIIDAFKSKRDAGVRGVDDYLVRKLTKAKAIAASALIEWRRANPELAAAAGKAGSTSQTSNVAASGKHKYTIEKGEVQTDSGYAPAWHVKDGDSVLETFDRRGDALDWRNKTEAREKARGDIAESAKAHEYVADRIGARSSTGDRGAIAKGAAGSDIGHKRRTDGTYVGAPSWVGNSPDKLRSLRSQIRKLALEGEPGRFWYEQSSRAILKFAGGDRKEAAKIVALIAIYSPNATVPANTSMALNAYFQFKAGQPIKAGLGNSNRKAEDLLRHNKPWHGIKTNSFYQNLMVEIDPSQLDPNVATMDMWMALAFDYGKKNLDQGPTYKFAEAETARLAQELGWTAHQVQAAIWTAIKARVESSAKGRKEYELANGIASLVPKIKVDAKGNSKTIISHEINRGQEFAHFRTATRFGLQHPLSKAEINASKYDFSHALEDRQVQMSWEATPGASTGVLPGLLKAPVEQQFEYLVAVEKALSDDGHDAIAKLIGMPEGVSINGFSAWQGATGAGAQTLSSVALTGTGTNRKYTPASQRLLDAYAAARGYVLNQAAVVYHHPVWDSSMKAQNGVALTTNRPLHQAEVDKLYSLLRETFDTDELAPAYRPDGARILNFVHGLDNIKFQNGMEHVVAQLPDDWGGGLKEDVGRFRSLGDRIENNWKESPHGESYLQKIAAFSPHLQGGLADLQARVEAVNKDFSKRYGWGAATRAEAQGSDAAGGRGAAAQGLADLSLSPKSEADIVNPIDRTLSAHEKVAQLNELTRKNQNAVQAYLRRIDRLLGTESKDSVKLPERIIEKANRPVIKAQKPWHDVEHIRDSYRFKTVIDNVDQLNTIIEQMPSIGAVVKPDLNKILNPKEFGWRIAVFDLRLPNGQLVEHYMTLKELESAKKNGGHQLFELVRNLDLRQREARNKYDEIAEKSTAFYNRAFDKYLDRTRSTIHDVRQSVDKVWSTVRDIAPDLSFSGKQAVVTKGAPHPAFEMLGAGRSQPIVLDEAHLQHIASTHPDEAKSIAALPDLLKKPRAILNEGDGKFRVILDSRDQAGRPLSVWLEKGKTGSTRVVEVKSMYSLDDSLKKLLDAAAMKTGRVWLPEKELSRVEGLLGDRHAPGAVTVHQEGSDSSVPKPLSSGSTPTKRSAFGPSTTAVSVYSDKALAKFSSASPAGWQSLKETINVPRGDLRDIDFSNKTVYRGTTNGEFDPALSEMGTFFTADREEAKQYGGTVVSARLSMNNPAHVVGNAHHAYELIGELRKSGALTREQAAAARSKIGDGGKHDSSLIADALRENGHDGIVFDNAGSSPWYVVFDKKQIQPVGEMSLSAKVNPQTDLPPEETKIQAGQRRAQDKFNRMDVIQRWAEAHGAKLTESAHTYEMEERMYGRMATRMEDFREKRLKPLVERVQKAGFTMEQVAEVLHAQHAEERNVQIAKVNPLMKDGGSGMKTADARAIMAKTPPKLLTLANEFQAITKSTTQILLDAGIINKEMVDAWSNAYKHYVPLKGGPEEKAAKTGTGPGLSVNAKNKRALGHQQREESIIENIMLDHERAIMTAEKNRVGQSLLLFATQLNNPEIIQVDKPVKRAVLKPKHQFEVRANGLTVDTFDTFAAAQNFIAEQRRIGSPGALTLRIKKSIADQQVQYMASPMLAENEAQVYVNGHAIRLQINDEILARQYKNLGVERLNKIFAMGRTVQTFLSRAYTGYNPSFIARNAIRDFGSGTIKIGSNFGPKILAKTWGEYPKAIGHLLRYSWSGTETPDIKAYRDAGGSTGAAWLSDIERLGRDVTHAYEKYEGAMAQVRKGKKVAAARVASQKTIGALVGWIEHLNMATENAMRLALFTALRKDGASVETAASAAKNSTVNFNRKGELGAQMSALYLFYNPNVQDTASVIQALTRGKYKGFGWSLLAGMSSLAYLLAKMQWGGDDDDYERWKKIPDSTRDRNLVFRTGKDSYITVPIPFGFGFFHTLGNTAFSLEKGDTLNEASVNTAANFLDHFSPLGNPLTGAKGWDKVDPRGLAELVPGVGAGDLTRDAARIVVNRNAFGGNIVPDSKYDEDRPDFLKVNRVTKGTIYDAIAKGLSKGTGGSDAMGGAVDMSPETLKFWTSAITGGTGTFLSDMTALGGLGARALMNPEDPDRGALKPEPSEIPIFKDYFKVERVADERRAYWDAAKEAESTMKDFRRAIKAGDDEGADKTQQQHAEVMSLAAMAHGYGKQIKALRDDVDAINADPDRSLANKRAAIKAMEREEGLLYDEFLHTFIGARREDQQRK